MVDNFSLLKRINEDKPIRQGTDESVPSLCRFYRKDIMKGDNMNEKNRTEKKNVFWGLGLMLFAMAVFMFIMTSYFSGVEEIMDTGVIPENFENVLFVVMLPLALCIIHLFRTGFEGIIAKEKTAKWRIVLASLTLAVSIILVVTGICLLNITPILAGNCFTMLFMTELISLSIAGVICIN